MKLDSKLRMSLTKRSGNVVLRRDLQGLASQSHLTAALKTLIADGHLVRLAPGVYAKAKRDARGYTRLAADPADLAKEVFQKLGIEAHVVEVGAGDGQPGYLLGKGLRPASPGTPFSLPSDVAALPTSGVGAFVEHLAGAHGVRYQRSGLDDFSEAVTRVAGDDVRLDHTGKLLVALKKKNLITGRQLARLMTNHLRESKRVRPVRGFRDSRLSPQR